MRTVVFLIFLFPAVMFAQRSYLSPRPASEITKNEYDFFFQDSQGFLWGTWGNDKVVRFDGHQAQVFEHNPLDSTTQSGCMFYAMGTEFVEDREGLIWVRSKFGCLDRFDPKTGRFESIADRISEQFGDPGNISDIFEDKKRNIWIATSIGAIRYNLSNQKFTRFEPHEASMYLIFQDTEGNIWVCLEFLKGPVLRRLNARTNQYDRLIRLPMPGSVTIDREDAAIPIAGTEDFLLRIKHFLFRFKPRTGEVTAVPAPEEGEIITVIHQAASLIYAATFTGKVYRISQPELIFEPVFEPSNNIDAGFFDVISGLTISRDDVLWTNSYQPHQYFLPGSDHFYSVPVPASVSGLADNDRYTGNSIFRYRGKIWFNTYPRPVLVRPEEDSVLDLDIRAPGFEEDLSVEYEFETDTTGNLWVVGAKPEGNPAFPMFVRKFSSEGILTHEYIGPGLYDLKGKTSALLRDICIDHMGDVWLADRKRVWKIKTEAGPHIEFVQDTTYPQKVITQLFVNDQGELFTSDQKRDRQTETWTDFNPFTDERPGNAQDVNHIFQDGRGIYWFSTNSGLVKWDPRTNARRLFGEEDLLPTRISKKTFEDAQNNIWVISSNAGFSKYDEERDRFIPFTWKEGVGVYNAPVQILFDDEGWVYVTDDRRFVHYFHPDSLQVDTMVPPVCFTGLDLFNQVVQPGDSTDLLEKTLDFTESITLRYGQNDITIHYTALEFIYNEEMKFAYQMEGFQDAWQEVGANRQARFTNLDPGSYTFKVKVRNRHGFWSESPRTLQIRVLPPWYRTTWAYLLWVFLILSLLYGIYRFQLRRRLAIAEAARLKEMDQAKSQLYTNITHEFRTPLTIILGMAEQVLGDPKNWLQEGMRLIRRNGKQLLSLVNQLLDLAKLESGQMELKLIRGDIVSYLHYLTESFHSYADSKDIRLHFSTDTTALHMDFDPEKLQNILSNLLSNAIKFTPAGGDVYLDVKLPRFDDQHLILQVRDNGAGIAPEHLPYIFDRFYQADASSTRRGEGTGIGLALTQELVKLMGGHVEVYSQLKVGARFTIYLPITRNAPEVLPTSLGTDFSEVTFSEKIQPVLASEEAQSHKPLVLLIEDNADVITYLSSFLSGEYQLETATNGQEGIDKAIELVPDLIVSDVMMPEKDGFEVCATLKTDERSSHIPIILLTAKSDDLSRLEGLTHGADAYLAKPFNKEELLVRIEKLIELRRKLQNRYQQAGDLIHPEAQPDPGPEDLFIQKLVAIVEENLSDENFGLPGLCKEAGLSRSQLFRKLKALTGKSTTNFIRSIRLAKAKELLETTNLNVSEVAYAVGFTQVAYFSTMFKEEFGVSPREIK